MLTCRVEKTINNIDCSTYNGLTHYKNEKIITIEDETVTVINVKTCQIESKVQLKYRFSVQFITTIGDSILIGQTYGYLTSLNINQLKDNMKQMSKLEGHICSVCLMDDNSLAISCNNLIIKYK